MMKETPFAERPRERCLTHGARSLSLRECLALIIGTGPVGLGCLGVAQQIIEKPGIGLSDSEKEQAFFTCMEVSGSAYLKEIEGLGDAGQAKVLAAFELGRRYSIYLQRSQQKFQKKPSIPILAAEALGKIPSQLRNEPQEWLGFVPLYRTGKLGEFCLVEKGVRTHINIDPTELFARILVLRPFGFFLYHNHPNGCLTPSVPDLNLTDQVGVIALSLGVEMLGHWIVTSAESVQIKL